MYRHLYQDHVFQHAHVLLIEAPASSVKNVRIDMLLHRPVHTGVLDRIVHPYVNTFVQIGIDICIDHTGKHAHLEGPMHAPRPHSRHLQSCPKLICMCVSHVSKRP